MRVIHPGVDECVTNRMLSLDSFKEAMKLFTADQVCDVPFALTMAAGGAGPPAGAGRGGRRDKRYWRLAPPLAALANGPKSSLTVVPTAYDFDNDVLPRPWGL